MKQSLMLGGLAASLLSGAAGTALAAGPLDAPLMLADRTLVRLERLDIDADPATGEPSESSRRRLQRLFADEPRRSCVVAAQVLGRIDRAGLDGGDPLEAHRRARARAERAAATLAAAGLERDRVVASWDPSRPGDAGRLTIWLMTDWSEPGCGLLPGDEPRVALVPPPSGAGVVERHAVITQAGSPAVTATATPPIAGGLGSTTRRPSPGEPDAVATGSDVASETATSAPQRSPSDVTSGTPRPNALDTLAALFGRIGSLFERDSQGGVATSPAQALDPIVAAAPAAAVPSPTVAGADAGAAPVAASSGPMPANGPAGPSILADLAPGGGEGAEPLPADVDRPVATIDELPTPPPARSRAGAPAARSDQPVAHAEQRIAMASPGPPDPLGQLRGARREAAPQPIAATPVAETGVLPVRLEPAAGGPSDELAFRFPANSSVLDTAQKRQLEVLARRLPTDRPVTLKLTVAVGSGDVAGADERTARRYNRWLAERRAARVERWRRHFAGDRDVALETSLVEDDPSRTAHLTLASGSSPGPVRTGR